MQNLEYKEIPEIRRKLPNIGVTTESLNRLPVFEPSMKPRQRERIYEGKYGKVTVNGRLGQSHKNLLETILWKKELHDFFKDGDKKYLKVLYDKGKVRRYISQTNEYYSHKGYISLLEDMKKAFITIETEKIKTEGYLIIDLYDSPTLKPINTKSPIIPKEVPLATIVFGEVLTALIDNELHFAYDPKPIMTLSNGISQAIVRFLRTHRHHPEAGYHLRELIKAVGGYTQGVKWRIIKKALREDTKKLESFGITIDFEKERHYVVEKQ